MFVAVMSPTKTPGQKRPTVFGANMRRLRLARGWTQEDLAARAKLSRSTVAKHENGAFQAYDDGTVAEVAKALEVNKSELFLEPSAWGATWTSPGQDALLSPAGSVPPAAGLEEYLKQRGYDLTAREVDELKTFAFRLRRGAVPGPDFWERILAALRSLPPE